MSGWGVNIQDTYNAVHRRAWFPVHSSQSGKLIWLKKYWRVEKYELVAPPGTTGVGVAITVTDLTEEEYLLHVLSKSPA